MSGTSNTRSIALKLLVFFFVFNGTGKHVACAAERTFSFNFNNVGLLNIPAFGLPLFSASISTEVAIQTNVRNSDDSNVSIEFQGIDPNVLEDAKLTTPQLISKYGYPAEIHHVVTEDGYVLELHRIVKKNAMPVLLTHGLLDSSATWVMMGPKKGLAYLLYDQGYDVWMTNMRGNTYSRNHTRYSTDHAVYWDFTFHEMGKYDLPATINHVLMETGYEQLHYIGHSQGTVVFWVMCSERPEYSDKVLLMQALAPVAFVKHCKSPVVEFISFFQEPLSALLNLIGAHEFLPNNEFVKMFSQYICDDDIVTKEVCTSIIFLIAGFDQAQLNETMLPVILGHSPAGASTKQMQHFGQLKRSGHFRQYDYGWFRNHWRYDSIHPPEYKLENVRTKVVLHYSKNDWLATEPDVNHLRQSLPNVVGEYLVNYAEFNHLDFVWGIDVRELLYGKVLRLMEKVARGQL